MANTTFLRLLPISIDAKGDVLAERIAALNAAGRAEDVFTLDPAAFAQIPGSPFAYWTSDAVRAVFSRFGSFESSHRYVRVGLSTSDDLRFLRCSWEVATSCLSSRWIPFAKGGTFSKFYCDLHLVLDWAESGKELRDFIRSLGNSPSRNIRSEAEYFRPGLTWPRRTNGFSVRVLAKGCIFADKGPVSLVVNDDEYELLALLGVMSSDVFETLVRVQLARTELAQSYEVGLIQNTPIPPLTDDRSRITLAALAREAHDLQRDRDRVDETTHVFGLPGLVEEHSAPSLVAASQALDAAEQLRLARLAAIQAEIDETVLGLYGLTIADLRLTIAEPEEPIENRQSEIVNEDDEEEEPVIADTLPRRVADLLQWCVGVALGRWDVRMALDPSLLPALAGPFDPLPRCAPGALDFRFSIDDLRLSEGASPQSSIVNLQSSIAWDGILVDDPTHPSDIVTRVRQVLRLLWGERADAVEQEACEALGVRDLRSWFRDPRQGFFAYHIKRYSKSRRKAPIYWLLQSEKRNYAIWLYCHRLHKHSLYVAGRDYADAKVRLEETRLAELREGLDGLAGSAKRQREREIDRQEKLVTEITAFRNTLDQIALRNLPPDLNDGVLLSVAPMHPLMPWKEAEKMWDVLVKGEYGWSTMSQQMKEKGLAMVN